MKKEKIILVLNGKLPKKADLCVFLQKYNKIVCADGATNQVIQSNIKPDLIMGDLDSIEKTVLEEYKENVVKLINQNYNDFQKILFWLKKKKYKKLDIIGMEGKRIDHLIGNFNIILKEVANFDLTIFSEFGIFYTVQKKRIFKKCKKKYFSLFSSSKNNKITTKGLKFKLDNKSLKNLEEGTLNFSYKDEVTIETEKNILVFIANSDFKK